MQYALGDLQVDVLFLPRMPRARFLCESGVRGIDSASCRKVMADLRTVFLGKVCEVYVTPGEVSGANVWENTKLVQNNTC